MSCAGGLIGDEVVLSLPDVGEMAMATVGEAEVTSAARGTVFVSETQLGIPGLVVSLLDVGDKVPANSRETVALALDPGTQRLGSQLTDAQGRFEIEFEGDSASAATARGVARATPPRRPSLLLVVTGPEGTNGRVKAAPPLFVSESIRRNAGRTESFAIGLPTERLKEAGISPPAEPGDPAPTLVTVGLHESRARAFDAGLRGIATARVQAERTRRLLDDTEFEQEFVKSISLVPRDLVRPSRYIASPSEIPVKNRGAIEDGVAALFSGEGDRALLFKTQFHLTTAQKKRLHELIGPDNRPLTAAEIRMLLLDSETPDPQAPVLVIREEPLLDEFLQQTNHEKCAEDHIGIGTAAEPPPASESRGGSPTKPLEDDDITSKAAELLKPMTPPEAGVTFVTPGRPAGEDVQGVVDGFIMRPGPADQPSLFDFHRLQIAFEHVWQELLDENAVELAREVNRRIRDAGGNPRDASHKYKPALRALRDEALLVEGSGANLIAPPASATRTPRTIFMRSNPALDIGSGLGRPGAEILDPVPPLPPLPPGPGVPSPLPPRPGIFDGGVVTTTGTTGDPRPRDLINELEAMLAEPYSFTIYGASPGTRSVNFGIMVTYRQRWEPTAYQAGELVKTIPLAPGEVRKFSYKQVTKRKRAEKEVENSSSLRKEEFTETTRAESEIVRKAMAKTNFSLTAEGTYNIGLAKGESTTEVGHEAGQDVQDTKRTFREAVIKAAQEYKQERTIEVNTETTVEVEQVESTEIANKNEELTVTYMFYELQRRFRVSEELYRITPVVMVAQEVPNPAQITEGFLLAHDWILKQALLDQEHVAAFEYLAKHVEGDRLALQELRSNVQKQRTIVDRLNEELLTLREQANRRYEALVQAVEQRAGAIESEDKSGFFRDLGEKLDIVDGESTEAARVREEAARDAEQRAVEQVKDLTTRLQREVTALNEITEKYAKQLREARNRQVQILRLRLHVKMYILHYMQAVWAFESPDQRFLRLHQVRVPTFADSGTEYRFIAETEGVRFFGREGAVFEEGKAHEFEVRPRLTLLDPEDDLPLEQVADLGEPLGFHGNYLVFPLKRPNALTEVLTAPYVDSGWELMDPSSPSHLNRAEFARYVCFLHERLSAKEFEAIRDQLKEMYAQLLLSPSLQGEEIVVPTDSLFIEALPGKHTLLEDFKLAHRAIDVKKAQAEARSAEFENLRKAFRLVKEELGDPDIEKVIHVEGGARVGVLTDDHA